MRSSTVGVGADDLVTGEAVALDLRHAGLRLRICSGLIDLLVGFGRCTPCSSPPRPAGSGDDALVAAAITLALIAALVAIPTTLETLTRGKTVGHYALGCGPSATTRARSRSAMPSPAPWSGSSRCTAASACRPSCAPSSTSAGNASATCWPAPTSSGTGSGWPPPARAHAAAPRVGRRGRHRPLPDSRRPRSASSSPAPGRSPPTCARSSPTGRWPSAPLHGACPAGGQPPRVGAHGPARGAPDPGRGAARP